MPNSEYMEWHQTDKLIKGWIIGTLTEDILQEVVGLEFAADVWSALKNSFHKSTMDRELILHHKLEVLWREQCETLDDYLTKYKTVCDELAAICKPLTENQKSFWMLNGLGSNYQMFTTMILRPPLLAYSKLLSMLHSYENRILLQGSTSSIQQVAFLANKATKQK